MKAERRAMIRRERGSGEDNTHTSSQTCEDSADNDFNANYDKVCETNIVFSLKGSINFIGSVIDINKLNNVRTNIYQDNFHV